MFGLPAEKSKVALGGQAFYHRPGLLFRACPPQCVQQPCNSVSPVAEGGVGGAPGQEIGLSFCACPLQGVQQVGDTAWVVEAGVGGGIAGEQSRDLLCRALLQQGI